jgi:hypothetical protein
MVVGRARFAAACVIGMILGLACAGPALADSATLSVTRTDGQVDPAADVPRVFTVSGATSAPTRIYVRHREPGGAPCGPNALSDSGQSLSDDFYGASVNGAFKLQVVLNWTGPGQELFCIWIAPTSSTVVTPITQVLDFRRPGGSISATLDPIVPRPGSSFTFVVSGTSEAPKSVYVTVENAATPCAPTAGSAAGTWLVEGDDVNGQYAITRSATAPPAGSYQLCLWLANSSSDLSPVAGPQSIPFSVVAPPKPCRVPALARGSVTLRTARKRLAKRGCRTGSIRYVRSRSVRRGRVLRLSPKGPRSLAPGAAVKVVVSGGRR